MKAEFLVENVEEFLPILLKIIPTHSQVPVLSNILLEAEKTGLYISSTNLETGIRIKIAAKIEEEGSITVPGRQFLEALSSLPKDKVTVSIEKENLVIVSRKTKISFQTIGREEFPTIFEEKGEKIYDFQKGELESIFSKVIFAASTDEGRPELTGILLSQKGEKTDFVATDGFRLSLKRLEGKKIIEDGEKLILPAKIIGEAMALKTDSSISMYIYKKANQIIFGTENVIIVGRFINGDFPNYEKVIPSTSKTKISLDQEEFSQKLRLSSVFARESANIVRLVVEEGQVKLFSKSSGVGEGEVALEAEAEGEGNEIAFNVKFLSDLLKNISSKTLSMELSSSIEPAVFKTDEDPEFLHIIMPVREQE